MKITTAPQVVVQPTHSHREFPLETAEDNLTFRIFQDGSGKKLVKFCRELSALLIRSSRSQDGIGEIADKLCASLMATLKCSEKQALCLIELSLELAHAKATGEASRSDLEISYLIATATGAVNDVSSN